jgi:fatty-acyl-CoA synthase
MRRSCCPVPTFHIFGEVVGTLNINAPGYFTAFPAILPDTLETMKTIQEEKCTSLIGAPIIFRDLLHHPKRKEYDLTSLLAGIIGAAPVNPAFMERLEREIPIKTLFQGFGQSENAASMAMSIFAGDDKKRRFTSVGKATPLMEMKIADINGRIMPIGEEGEICARGFNVMQGTSSSFEILKPFFSIHYKSIQDIMVMKRKHAKQLLLLGGYERVI